MKTESEMEQQTYDIHLVSHTHWDREWYATVQEFRIRLVRLMDKLLDILDTTPAYRHFVLDGQTILLEDYLEIRPEKKEKLYGYLKSGRLQAGPWYVMPDEFLVSGEAIIRNLMIGHRICEEFGGAMKVGYQPDPFGHIAQLPQILNGFDIDSAMFMRGMGNEGEDLGIEFIWRAPDGSEVLAIHLVSTGYEGGYAGAAALGYPDPWTPGDLSFELALKKSCDLLSLQAKYAQTKHLLFCNGTDHIEPQRELPQIIDYLNERLPNATVSHSTYTEYLEKVRESLREPAVYEGELRGARYAPVLVNTLSSRMAVKQKNFSAQVALEKLAEPLAVFAFLEGWEYPSALLWQSWKYLIQTHPHDTICGCGIDKVHEEALQRADWSEQISAVIAGESMAYLAGRTPDVTPGNSCMAVFNTLPWPRTETVPFEGWEYNLSVPACGYRVYSAAELAGMKAVKAVSSDRVLENASVRVEAREDGTLTVTDKATGLTYENLNSFEDEDDSGDEYNRFPAETSMTVSTLQEKPTIRRDGSSLSICYSLCLPISIEDINKRRSEQTVLCPLTTSVFLEGESPIVRVKTQFDNRARNHRLRVCFNTGINASHSLAEGQFQVVRRPLRGNPEDWVMEYDTGDRPQQNFVVVEDGGRGLIVANKGLPEYQLCENGKLYITLLRCTEWITNLDWVDRKKRMEPTHRVGYAPGAQCQGINTYEYAIIPFSGAWENRIKDVYNYIVPVKAQRASELSCTEKSYFEMESQSLLISAIKKAQRSDSIIVRIVNPTGSKELGLLKTFAEPREVYLTKLNEDRIRSLTATKQGVHLEVGPYQILTVEMVFQP